jgi:RNA polymerase sigma-70 factor (ECF subfamily)
MTTWTMPPALDSVFQVTEAPSRRFRRHYRGTAKRNVAREIGLDPAGSSRAAGPSVPGRVPTPSKQMATNERALALERALVRLPEEYRRVILLRHDEGQSFEDIGKALGRSANAARKLWVRAIERLEDELESL